MSLLLDALKPTESDLSPGVEPESSEPHEEALDAAATLALLVSKPVAQTPLSLVHTPGDTSAPFASAPGQFDPGHLEPGLAEPTPAVPAADGFAEAAEPGPPAPPEAVVEPVRATNPERSPAAAAGRIAQTAPAPGIAAATAAMPRAIPGAPPAPPRAKIYALVCAALATLVGLGIVGKSLWWPSTSAFTYPAAREGQPAPEPVQPTTPSVAAVQIPSERPVDQFADAGYAPEIDLHNAGPPAAATAPAIAPPSAGASPPASTMQRVRGRKPRASLAGLSVTRTEGQSPVDQHVQAGYLALASGNVSNARTEYLAALELDPNNVDALMGAATVALRSSRPKDAVTAYGKVLKLEPGNPDATAALATLGADGATGENNESRLKILIAGGDGGRPALHAALAGVYAADSRWAEAAQEYFTALARDPGNPDLAFDVAASLDQNRNPGMALNYYGQALMFARERATQIDLRAVEQRIAQLQAHAGRVPGAPETR